MELDRRRTGRQAQRGSDADGPLPRRENLDRRLGQMMRSSSGYQSPSPVDKLPVNLAPDTVNDRYREVLVVPQTAVTNMPRKLPAMLNRFGIGHKLKAHAITWTNAIFHVEEKFLHYQVLVTAGVLRPSALGCTFSRLG